MEVNPGDLQLRPVLGKARRDLESAWCGLKAEETVEHHLRHEDALEQFLVQAQPARDVPALHGATLGVLGVVGAVAALGLQVQAARSV